MNNERHKLAHILLVVDKPANLELLGHMLRALANVFDAPTYARPHKKVWMLDAAAALTREYSGKHFAPSMPAICLRELPRTIALQEQPAGPEMR